MSEFRWNEQAQALAIEALRAVLPLSDEYFHAEYEEDMSNAAARVLSAVHPYVVKAMDDLVKQARHDREDRDRYLAQLRSMGWEGF